jgi:hypothetical protein
MTLKATIAGFLEGSDVQRLVFGWNDTQSAAKIHIGMLPTVAQFTPDIIVAVVIKGRASAFDNAVHQVEGRANLYGFK